MNSKAVSRRCGGRKTGPQRLTFSPAAEVYSPRRTSITAASREPSSGHRLRPKPLFPGIIAAVRTGGRFVWYPCVFFPPSDSDTPHVCLLHIRHQKRSTSHLSFKIRVHISPCYLASILLCRLNSPSSLPRAGLSTPNLTRSIPAIL